jgi:hypothetical protein
VFQNPNQLRHADVGVRDALRFTLVVAVAAAGFLAVAAVWVSTCSGSVADPLACGVPQRTLLAVGAPAILLLGGIRAFVRTFQSWRREQPSWAWQGAGWVLLALMSLVLSTSTPMLGTPLFG